MFAVDLAVVGVYLTGAHGVESTAEALHTIALHIGTPEEEVATSGTGCPTVVAGLVVFEDRSADPAPSGREPDAATGIVGRVGAECAVADLDGTGGFTAQGSTEQRSVLLES